MAEKAIINMFEEYECQHLYLDAGTNIGVQIRKLFEPEKYPGSLVLPIFDKYFGRGHRCKVCAIGFEPNPKLRKRLEKVQSYLSSQGHGVLMLYAAAGTTNGKVDFQTPTSTVDKDFDWTGSTMRAQNLLFMHTRSDSVDSLNVAQILHLVHHKLRIDNNNPNAKIVMKSDIEGSEYLLFTHMILQSAMCLVDYLFAEWHASAYKVENQIEYSETAQIPSDRSGANEAFQVVRALQRQYIRLFRKSSKTCRTIFSNIDDEHYRLDGKPFSSLTKKICKLE